MAIVDIISDILFSLGNIFETNQEEVINSILRAEKVIILDTCFITKLYNMQSENVFEAFEKFADGKDKQNVVFVVTELVLYELKDSSSNELQAKNKEFFEKMSENGFCLLILKEESVCENIKPLLKYSNKKWNEVFKSVIHDNVADLSFNNLIKTDTRMPYFGFSEFGYNIPGDGNFIRDILLYLKNAKANKDSMAEELVCTSLFIIFELTQSSNHNKYIFCSHDLRAIARMNKAIQTSYPNMQKQFKTINAFSFVQYMIKNEIITSKDEVIKALKKIMGENVNLIIVEEIPFSSLDQTITIEEAVERIFNGEHIELLGRKDKK